MNNPLRRYLTRIIVIVLTAALALAADSAMAGSAPFSPDSLWFYRDGVKVVPEMSRRWLTAVLDQSFTSGADGIETTAETLIMKKARHLIRSDNRLVDFLYDPNIAEDAFFLRLREGLKSEEIGRLIGRLSRDRAFRYVQPTLILDNKTFAFFNMFQMEWKTGTGKMEREALLRAAHVTFEENENRYLVDVRAAPFFRALNLLAEDIRVLRVTPHLVEIRPSISAKLSLSMGGGNLGDSIPFTLNIDFSDRVNIDPSSIATLNLRPANLQKELFDCVFDPYDYAKAVSKSPISITGRMRFYAPGEFTIPAVTLTYSCPSCPGITVRTMETKPVLFKVSSIMPSARSEYRLIVPTDPVEPDYRLASFEREAMRHRWIAVTALAGFILCALWLFLLRHRVSAARTALKERVRDGHIADELRALLDAEPAPPHWKYLGEAGALLRGYLLAKHGIDPKYQGGSGRQFMDTIAPHIPGEWVEPLGGILAAIDDNVSLETERCQEIDQLRQKILSILDSAANHKRAAG